MRRSYGASSGIIKLNRMSVDLPGKRLCIDDGEVELTAREWSVLECLVRRVGLIVSKERLQQAVANPDHDITPNAVEVHVSRLESQTWARPPSCAPCAAWATGSKKQNPRDLIHQPPIDILAGGAAHGAGAVRRAGALLQ